MPTRRYTVREFLGSLREGPHTSLGSYPKYWVLDDGSTLSHAGCLAQCYRLCRALRAQARGYDRADREPARFYSELERGWLVVGIEVNWEDPLLYCEHTNERIPSAYAEES